MIVAPYNPATVKQMRALASGHDAAHIATLLGWSVERVLNIAKLHGIDVARPSELESKPAEKLTRFDTAQPKQSAASRMRPRNPRPARAEDNPPSAACRSQNCSA